MSFLAPKTELPGSLSDNTPGRNATRSPKQVVPLVFGRFRVVVQMITPVLHWHFRTSKTSQYAFASGFGAVCLGPIDEAVHIIVNEKRYAAFFAFRDETPGAYVEHVLAKETPETYRLYWGLEDHANYSAYLQSLVRDPAHPMYGKSHPSYHGICTFAFNNLDAGQSSGGSTPPLPKIEIEGYRRSPTAYSFGYAAHGTHPMGVAKDILTLKRGGLKLPESYFDAGNVAATLTKLMDVGVAGMKGTDIFTSHVFAEPKEASEQLADVLSYFDGYVVERGGKLLFGYSPNDGTTINPAGLTTINQHHLAGEIEDQPGTLDGLPSQVVVTGLDWQSDPPLSEASETAQVPFAQRFLGEQRPARPYDRAGYTTRRQLKSSATLTAAIVANPDWEATVPLLRQYALLPDGLTPLRPGDLFVLNVDQVGGINLVVRILSRESVTPVAAVYRVRRERGTFPRPYEPGLDPRASITPPVPADLVRYAVKELPPALATVPAVTALVERPSNSVSAYEVHFSPTNSWPGQVIAKSDRWCVAAVLQTNLAATAGDVTINVDTVGADWAYLASQSALEQRDDTLIGVHGDEWFSVGTITPLGGGGYSITLKRARLDSELAVHAVGAVMFFCFRSLLAEVRHASFADLFLSSVYDAGTATKWFKLRPQSNGGFGNLTAPFSITIQEPDVELDDPTLFYDFIFKRAPTAPATPTGSSPAGWSDGPPAGFDPVWMSRAVRRQDTGALVVTWSAPIRLDGQAGTDGTNGLSNAIVFIYQRAASAPALPSASATYTFATKALTGLDNGWSATIPAGSNPLYVSAATASATGAADTIAAGEWAGAVILAQDGTSGGGGGNSASVFIYQRAASAPSLPSVSTTYTFATSALTGLNNGWSQIIPGGTDPLYVSTATAFSTGATDSITAGEWAAAQILARNGTAGGDGASVQVEWSVDGATGWHYPFAPGDIYFRQRLGGGAWSAAIRGVGEKGDKGDDGDPGDIPPDTITTIMIQDGAVSSISAAYSGGGVATSNPSGGVLQLQEFGITCTGEPVAVKASACFSPLDNFTFAFQILLDGVNVYEVTQKSPQIGPCATPPIMALLTPSAGYHNLAFYVYYTNAFWQATTFTKRYLEAFAFKK